MKKIIHPCDMPLYDGKKYPVFCEIEYKNGRLSITGVIAPMKSGNAMGGCGQISMEFEHRDPSQNDTCYDNLVKPSELRFAKGWNSEMWLDFLDIWEKWHLNDMHSECVHQEQKGITYSNDPKNICEECGYKIGSAWTKRSVPQDVLDFLFSLPDTDRTPNWI